MLENFKKYTGVMFVVLILLFVGLTFFASNLNRRGYGSGAVVVEVGGRGYTEQEYNRLAQTPLRLLNDLSQQSFQARLAIASYLFELATPPEGMPGRDTDSVRFLVNRLILQNGARKFGIHPSNADVEEFLRETVFIQQDGSFNQEAYDAYVEGSLPRLGMSIQDMNELVGEVLSLQEIQDVLGAGIEASRDAVRESVADRQQQIDYQLVTFPATNYENDQQPTDEEVNTYWEEHKGRYLSDPKRKITYILASPDEDALLEEKKQKAAGKTPAEPESGAKGDPGPAGTTEAADTTQPADTTEPAEPAEPAAPVVTLTPEEKEKAVIAIGAKLDGLWDQIQQQGGKGFGELAKKAGFELKTTELFTPETAPAEFKVPMRDAPGKRAVDILFARDKGTTPLDAISDVRRLGQDEWLLFRVDESEDATELDFESAKDEARLDLVKERARKAMTKAAEEARESIVKAMEGGKSFQEAATELELKPVSRTAVTLGQQVPGEPTHQAIFDLASKINPGEVSEVLTQEEDTRSVYRALFAFVEKRELVDSEANTNMVDQRYRSMGSALRRLAVQNWLAQEYQAADVRKPNP